MNTTHTTAVLRTSRKHRKSSKAALRRGILGAGIAALLHLPGRAAGVLIHDYQFNGNFADSLAGSALVPLNGTGTLNPTSYSFAKGQGLSLSSGLPSAGNYSIVADFSFATTSSYQKIVDFKTQTADAGLYSYNTQLYFYPASSGPSGAFANNVTLSLALTRDGTTNQVVGYVNGVQQIIFTDISSYGVFSAVNNEIRFFIDDNATGGSEASAGVVDRIRIYDGALTAAQVNPSLAPATHWLGGTNGKWTGNNWASDATGTPTTATPTGTDDVTFSATGAANRITTLEQNFTIHSLTINDTAPVGIASGTGINTLTISGSAGTGITVNSGANLTISAKVTLAGSSDTIAVNGAGVAAISGVLGSTTARRALIKTGTGTLTLSGANTYTGGTTLVAGSLAAGNAKAFGSGNLTLQGGTLRTTGGPLAVDIGAGNILFGGGTYLAMVGGTMPGGLHDQLKTIGTANINGGTLALVQQNGFLLAPGVQVVLLSATAGVAGGSANGTAVPGSHVTGLSAFSNTPLLVPVVNLYTTSVVLEAMQGSFAALSGTLGLTPNQLAVATALDSVATKLGGKSGVFSELNFLDTQALSTLAGNLDKISPEELTSMFNIAVSLANVQSANVLRRTDEIRGEGGGGGAMGGVSGTGGGAHGPIGHHGKEIPSAPDERLGLWFTGSGEFTHVGSTTNAAGFSLDSGGVTAGVDYRFTDHFAAGISLGYMNTTASLSNGGKVDVDGGRVGAYATYFDRGFHLDASVSGGPNSYATRRTTPNNTVATGSPGGTEVNLLFAAGYDWKWKGLTIGPTASFQYTNVQLDGFTERGTFAPLSVIRKNADSARTSLGFRATFDAKVRGVTVRPEVRAAWQHEFGDTSYSLTSSFATLGGSAFTVFGPSTGRDSLLVGAGFSILWNARFSTYAFYDGELLRQNYSSNNISVGARWRF